MKLKSIVYFVLMSKPPDTGLCEPLLRLKSVEVSTESLEYAIFDLILQKLSLSHMTGKLGKNSVVAHKVPDSRLDEQSQNNVQFSQKMCRKSAYDRTKGERDHPKRLLTARIDSAKNLNWTG